MSSRLAPIFRNNVASLLKEYGWTQNDLANEMEVTKGYVSQMLNAHVGVGLEAVDRFAKALQVEPSTLIQENKVTAKAG